MRENCLFEHFGKDYLLNDLCNIGVWKAIFRIYLFDFSRFALHRLDKPTARRVIHHPNHPKKLTGIFSMTI